MVYRGSKKNGIRNVNYESVRTDYLRNGIFKNGKKISETSKTKMNILVTGAAGFIGFHLSKSLKRKNTHIIGIDNLNNYYDVNLKKNRLQKLKKNKNFFL